ncbi:unnamed protein product, partial [Mesorhabditis belari]|uniref:Uncharacterized protein n=1 Tax=Mesorhabditis belari TaxID=2138241 RepID=A0AAF3J6V2_9BILA
MLSTATGIQADNLLRNDLAKFQKDFSTKIWSADRNKVKCLLQTSIKNYAKKLASLELSGETLAKFCQKFIQDSAHYLKSIFGATLDIGSLETELKVELRALKGFSLQARGRSDSSDVAQNNDLSQKGNWKELLVKRFIGKLAKHLQEDR